MARPRKYKYTPEELEVKLEEFRTMCETHKDGGLRKPLFPSEPKMRLYLGLTKEDVEAMCNDSEDKKKYQDIFARETDYREDWLLQKATNEPKQAQGCFKALEQAANGGYSDKLKNNNAQTLNINIQGGHGAELFK